MDTNNETWRHKNISDENLQFNDLKFTKINTVFKAI